MKAYLIYKNMGLRWAFTIKKPGNDVIFDEIEIELPKGATVEYKNDDTPYIMGNGEIPNEELTTIAKNGTPHPAISQVINGKPVSTIMKYKIIE